MGLGGAQAGRIALALSVGAAGGWLFQVLDLPLPWMLGAMVASTTVAAAGLPVRLPNRMRDVMVAVLGVMLGSAFSPALLGQLADWGISLAMLALSTAAAGGVGLLYLRRVAGYDPVTAYFAASPGGLGEMTVLGAAMGGDDRVIALTHSTRVMLMVLAVPFAFRLFEPYDPAQRAAADIWLLDMGLGEIALLAGVGLAGAGLARLARLPAATLMGPMILSAAVHLAGLTESRPPAELVAASQVVVGTAIGCRFAGIGAREFAVTCGRAAIVTGLLLGTTVAAAAAMHRMTSLPFDALVLAYAPGGLAEMSLVALALGADAAFVSTHHLVRILLVIVLAPIGFRLGPGRRSGTETGGR